MTIDDENSIYVGGLPYDATEEDLSRAFSFYGAIVGVKIVNDREVGGKCYGFVTFTNPRSAEDAIHEMDGKLIGGRAVRVNEVRTRGGRPTFRRENFRREGRELDWDRDRDRDRDRDHIRDRDRFRDRNIERPRDRDRDRDYERGHGFDRARDHTFDRGRDRSTHDQEHARAHDLDQERDHDMDWDHEREMDKTKIHDVGRDKEQHSRNRPSAQNDDRQSRELSSNSNDEHLHWVKEELEMSIHRHEELQKEVEQIDGKINEHEQLVSDLRKKAQKLEDALATAKKLTSQRQSMLTKLHRCFMLAQDYTERVRSSEQELKSIVDTTMAEIDLGEEACVRDGSAYGNGQA